MTEDLGAKIEEKMHEVLNKTLITLYKAFDEDVYMQFVGTATTTTTAATADTTAAADIATKRLLIAAILNIMVQVSGHLFYQLPQMFPGMPMNFDFYSTEVLKAMKQSFEKISIFYHKHQKKDDLIQFINGEKDLDIETIKTYKELH